MHTPSLLSPTERATLDNLLEGYLADKGPLILGAQLGQFIAQALKPRTVQQVGGFKTLVSTDLKDALKVQEAADGATDVEYEIQSARLVQPLPEDLAGVPDQVVELSRKVLWRVFSNPRIDHVLLVGADGRIYASAQGTPIPEAYRSLAKPDGRQFRELAEQFAERQTDLAVKGFLKTSLEPKEFYDGWIKELRRLRTPSSNLLREWETLKSEYVANQLHAGLLDCGVDTGRAAEVVAKARPVVRPHSPLAMAPVSPSTAGATKASQGGHLPLGAGDEAIVEFRQLVHVAIDLMSIAELRELKIAAGLLYDATRRMK